MLPLVQDVSVRVVCTYPESPSLKHGYRGRTADDDEGLQEKSHSTKPAE